ncbi:hypothetical protein ACFW2D_04955 [Streptomyces sp. NPDC058914]|uniref:hypothetical protein n=1 Tax=Streptomyces sp. NPDC058914 TaxID=3346671 RepID=UPI0036B0125B
MVEQARLLAGVSAAAPKEPENLDALLRPMMTALVAMLLEHPDSARVICIKLIEHPTGIAAALLSGAC